MTHRARPAPPYAHPAELPEGVIHLSEPLAEVANSIAARVEHEPAPPIEPLLWTFATVFKSLGVSRRTIERERSAGRFPKPDLFIGRRPMWKPTTIRLWIEDQSRKGVRR
jgi:hypothetical protein